MCPYDPYHTEVGMDIFLVNGLLANLNKRSKESLSNLVNAISKGLGRPRLQQLANFKSYRFIDVINLIMVLPYSLLQLAYTAEACDQDLLLRFAKLSALASRRIIGSTAYKQTYR